MDRINNARFKRWEFSSEAVKLGKELNLFTEHKEDELPGPWCLLLSYIPSNENAKETDENEDFLSHSSVSTTVDDEEWEDLELYMKECENRRKMKHDGEYLRPSGGTSKNESLISENCDKLNNMSLDSDKISNENKITGRSSTKELGNQQYEYNIFSQMCCTQELVEHEETIVENDANDTIAILKEAVMKEESNTEEIAELLPQLSKQQLSDLWMKLDSSDSGRLRLYSAMAECKYRTVFLCQKLLLPWLANGNTERLNDIVRKIAVVLPKISDFAIKNLILPLIANNSESNSTNNPFLKESYLLQDIMSHLGEDHWNCLLRCKLLSSFCRELLIFFHRELLSSGMNIESNHFQSLKVVIESCSESVVSEVNTMSKLFGLINSVINNYAKDRDFGLLILAVINCVAKVEDVSPAIINSLKDIADSYKGPMRFRISALIKQLGK